MNYMKVYVDLIHKAKDREINNPLTCYKENHHIIPSCISKDNSKDNRVDLTAKEHFIAHALLCHIFPNNYKIASAFNAMSQYITKNRYISGNRYSKLREQYSKLHSKYMIGNTNFSASEYFRSGEHSKNLSLRMIGNSYGSKTLGYKRSKETRELMSISRVNSDYYTSRRLHKDLSRRMQGNKYLEGFIHSESTKDSMSKSRLSSEYRLSGRLSKDLSKRSIGNTYSSNPIQLECIFCKEVKSKSVLTKYHGPESTVNNPNTSKCRLKSLDLGTSW